MGPVDFKKGGDGNDVRDGQKERPVRLVVVLLLPEFR